MVTKKDPLLKRMVTINADATTNKGAPHPQAGLKALVVGKTPGGRQYQLDCDGTLVTLPMADFTLITLDGAEPQLKSEADPEPHALLAQMPRAELNLIVRSRTNRQVVEDDELYAMAASIKAHGILQPLLLRRLPAERLQDTFENPETRKAQFEIIAGERRFVASRIAGERTVPYMLVAADNLRAVQMQLIENLHRRDLDPLEEAKGVILLVEEFKLTREEAADSIGKSRTHVFESLRLLSLQPKAMAALKDGRLSRSLALLVLQRPTAAMQEEFAERILTGGADGGPMSYRAAQDLARRNYMTELDKAPFDLADATLCPQAGACTHCPKRTGATPELWDKHGPDACTDTTCFAEKKEAHLARVKAEAAQAGRQVITGRAARDIMPTETGSMRGYIALDKASQGSKAETRQVLGQDVPASRVVLVETPAGGLIEAVPVHAASAAVQAQAAAAKPEKKAKAAKAAPPAEPSRAELEAEYARRWREEAVASTIDGLYCCKPESLSYIPSHAALHILKKLAAGVPREILLTIFHIPLNSARADDNLEDSFASASEQDLPEQLSYILQLACTADLKEDPAHPGAAPILEELRDLADVDLEAIQAEVQDDMKAEAAKRAGKGDSKGAAKPKATQKPGTQPKTSKADATAAIAQAMQAAEANHPNDFKELQQVRILRDLKFADALLPTKDRKAVLLERMGDRAWWLELPKDAGVDLDDMDHLTPDATWEITADYTEIQALDESEAGDA
ncbi:ParB/RepB/Spo0J family partition protein [Comamonas terrae]|uniref:ParB/RepB/Spo0J family partition protein n=1 Tax=Comamonas terrae TaxID=673548 RepID=A0ABW5UKU9_9BURK|nr:ParB/RepB/Spo0J family partition protein [Comamonas terrae]